MEKPGSWFALTKGVKSICGREKLSVMIQVTELHLYLKSHTSNGAFYTLCLCNSVTWPGFSIKRTLYNIKINNGRIVAEKRPSMVFLSSAICKFAQSWWSTFLSYFIMYSLKIHIHPRIYSSHVITTWA